MAVIYIIVPSDICGTFSSAHLSLAHLVCCVRFIPHVTVKSPGWFSLSGGPHLYALSKVSSFGWLIISRLINNRQLRVDVIPILESLNLFRCLIRILILILNIFNEALVQRAAIGLVVHLFIWCNVDIRVQSWRCVIKYLILVPSSILEGNGRFVAFFSGVGPDSNQSR